MSGPLRRGRSQQMARIYAVMACLLIVVVAQLVLLLVAVEGFWRGQMPILLVSTFASALGVGAASFLIRYILPGRNHAKP